jgi:hypothetical protein
MEDGGFVFTYPVFFLRENTASLRSRKLCRILLYRVSTRPTSGEHGEVVVGVKCVGLVALCREIILEEIQRCPALGR